MSAPKRAATELSDLNPSGVGLSRGGLRPELPEDIQAQLYHVGSRVRHQVSNGHRTSSTQRSLSYLGDDVGPTDRQSIEAGFKTFDQTATPAFKAKSAIELRRETAKAPRGVNLKRRLDETDEDDGDTDADEELPQRPSSMSQIKAFYSPHNYASANNQAAEDFEEATFLQPKGSFQ